MDKVGGGRPSRRWETILGLGILEAPPAFQVEPEMRDAEIPAERMAGFVCGNGQEGGGSGLSVTRRALAAELKSAGRSRRL